MDYLKPLLAEYRYGKFGLLERDFTIHLAEDRKSGRIEGFNWISPEARNGDCCELAHSLELRLWEEHPEVTAVVVWGNDPKYFTGWVREGNRIRGTHKFVLASHDRRLQQATIEDFSRDYVLRELHPYVLDPSFGVVAPLSKSGYKIGTLVEEMIFAGKRTFYFDQQYRSTILGKSSLGAIVALMVDVGRPQIFQVSQRIKSEVRFFDLNDPLLAESLRDDPELLAVIRKIHSKNPLAN